MKSLLILALAGLACSQQSYHQYFSPGQEYVYSYTGRILTGIPLSGSTQQPTNWRNVKVESSTPLTSQYKQYMESPVEFSVEQGQFSTMKVSSEEPHWSVNFKKALVANLKVQQPQQSSQTEERRNPRFWYVQQQQDSQEHYYWTTMEEGIV